MNDDPPNEPSTRERLERLERTVGWMKFGVGLLLGIFALSLIPPLATVAVIVLYVAIVGGAVIGLIIGIMQLLERYFPGDRKRS